MGMCNPAIFVASLLVVGTPEMVAERDRIQRSASLLITRNAIGGEISGVVAV
jgi:hypothetical protein